MSNWIKGQILELTSSGALSKGKKVTVVSDFSQSDLEKGYSVSCSFEGKNYQVTPAHLKEINNPMWRKGQPAVIIESGAISRGTYVTVEKDFNVEDIRRGNSVQCNYDNKSFYVTPHHLGDPN